MKTKATGPAAAEATTEESVMREKKSTKAKTAAKSRTSVKGKTKKATESKQGTKLQAIAKLLQRADGCTTAEVLKATGWPSVSLPQQARALGIKLKTEKGPFGPEGRTVTRYRAA